MGRSYFPTSDAKQLIWANNYKTKIDDVAPQLGLTPEQATKQKDKCDAIIASITNVATKRAEHKAAVGERTTVLATTGGSLRADISNLKTLPNYSEAIGQTLGVISQSPAVDFANFKPKMTIDMYGGMVRIKFKKMDTDGINIYRRRKGTVEWLFFARANKSPFDHAFVLQTAGQPELWEYRSFGVVDDGEVGVVSDVVEVVYTA